MVRFGVAVTAAEKWPSEAVTGVAAVAAARKRKIEVLQRFETEWVQFVLVQ